MRLYLLRHGEVARLDLHYGHTDVPLSARGRAQAEHAARVLADAPVSSVHGSDLVRAAYGAECIARHHGLAPKLDSALRELHLGLLEGLSHAESRESHPQLYARRYADLVDEGFPGGESLREVATRVRGAFQRLVAAHAGETIAIVAHNSVNRILLADALGLPLERMFGFKQSYGCINRIDYGGERPRVVVLNWTPDAPCGEAGGSQHPATIKVR